MSSPLHDPLDRRESRLTRLPCPASIRSLAARRRLAPLALFLAALCFRIVVVETYHTRHLSSDGMQYYELARQVAIGNGFSIWRDGHLEPHFFREPGYSLFAALPLAALRLFGQPVEKIDDWDLAAQGYTAPHTGVAAIKYAQAIVDALNVVLLFMILCLVLDRGQALVVSVLHAFYPPAAFACTDLLREVFLTFLTLNMAYFFALYLFGRRPRHLVLYSVFWGASLLTFQAMLLAPLAFAALSWLYFKRDLRLTLRATVASTAIALAIVSINVVRAYRYYPDVRVARNLGYSLTHEWMAVASAQRAAQASGLISEAEMERFFGEELYAQSDAERFRRSFDGYYAGIADSLNARIGLPQLVKVHVKVAARNFVYSWFRRPVWPAEQGPNVALAERDVGAIVAYGLAAAIGCLALLGTVVFYRDLYPILLTYTYFVCLFYVIGSEPRRMLPAVPFFVLFAYLAAVHLAGRRRRRERPARLAPPPTPSPPPAPAAPPGPTPA